MAPLLVDWVGDFPTYHIHRMIQRKLLLTLGLGCHSLLAMAQSPSVHGTQHPDHELQDVVVVGSRMPEIKQRAAASITIIPERDIREMSQILPDMQAIVGYFVPGVPPTGNNVNERYNTLRGRSILVLIDGIPQSTPLRATSRDLRSIDPAAVERIEVIKGATAIFGNGANGGIINIVTKQNKENRPFGGQSQLSYTDHNFFKSSEKTAGYRLSQQVYGQAGSLSYLVDGAYQHTGSAIAANGVYLSPRYGLGDTRTINTLAKLGYRFSDRTQLELMYNFFRTEQDGPLVASGGKYLVSPRIGVPGTQPAEAMPEGLPYNHNAYLKLTSREVFAQTDLEVSLFGRSIKSIADYRKHNPKSPRWEETSGQAVTKASQGGARAQLFSRLSPSSQLNLQLLYGADFLLDQTSQPLVDGRYWVPKMTSVNYAPFVQGKAVLSDLLTVKAGARYDWIDVRVPDYTVLRTKKSDPLVQVAGGTLGYRNLSLNVGATYNGLKFFQPFVSYSEGFSIYDLGRTLRSAKADVLSKIETDPVRTHNYEAGFYSHLSDLFGEGTRLDLQGAFYYTYAALGSDLISQNGFWVVDRSPQRIYGMELGAEATLSPKLSLGATFSALEGRKRLADGSWNGYMSGQSIPPLKLTAHVSYRPIKDLSLRLFALHTGSRDRFAPKTNSTTKESQYAEGEGVVKPISLLSLQGAYRLGAFTVGLGVENLLNTTYYPIQSQLVARDAEYTQGNGRMVTLSLSYRY